MKIKNDATFFYTVALKISGVFAGLCIIGIIALAAYYGHASEEIQEMTFDWTIDDERNETIYAKVTSGNSWTTEKGRACQYDGVIKNLTKYELTDWELVADIPLKAKSNSMWNGIWKISDGKATFTPLGIAEVVASESYQTFGLVIYSDEAFEMNDITLTFRKTMHIQDTAIFWILISLIVLSAIAGGIFLMSYIHTKNFQEKNAVYKDLVNESLRTIANIIDTKDEYTRGHSVRVAIYSRMLAERMGLSEADQERIYYIGMLHDIGKIGVPSSILTKPGRLTDDEFEIIKRHTRMGASIMKDFSSIKGAVDGIRYHHERFDGGGYNEGLSGSEIPLEGRIICVADSYDAMSSRRCYRNTLDYEYILGELKKNIGKQFDPDIVKHMIDLIEEGYAPVSEEEMELTKNSLKSKIS